jgi:hypothetical protein
MLVGSWSRWGLAFAMLPFAACGSSDSSLAEDSASNGDDEAGASEGTGEGTLTGTATADPDTGANDDANEDTGAAEDSSGGQTPDAGCENIDCGGNGQCVGADDGPACMCEDGFAPLGLTCIPCSPPASPDVALELVTGTIRLTVNDLVPPTSDIEDAVLKLRNAVSGDEVLLGNTHDGDLPVVALPGSYELVYGIDSGGTMLPRNREAVIGTLDLVDEVDEIVNIQVGRLMGAITIAEETPPNAEFDQGRVWLRNADNGDSVLLGSTMYGAYDVLVLPGQYLLHYEHVAGPNVPANADVIIGKVDVVASEVPAVLDIDIPMTGISGAITIAEETPPDSAIENGRLTLSGTTPGDVFPLSQTRYGAYEINVVPGSYAVVYEWVAGSSVVPANTRAQLPLPLDAYPDVPAPAIDVPVVVMNGAFTLGDDSTPPPADPTDDGNVFLRQGGDSVYLGNTAYGAYERRVIPGTYELYFGQDSSRGGVPTNTNALIANAQEISGGEMNIAIPFVLVDGSITIGGEAPPSSDYDDGHVYLRNPATLDSVLLANTRESTFSAMVVPGVYDIVYAAETPGGEMPVNAGAVIGSVDVGAKSSFGVDVPVLQAAGNIMLDGNTPPVATDDLAFLYLVDAQTLDPVYLGSTAAGGYSRKLTPGDYLVFYRVQQSTGLVPANANANLGCWTLDP